MEAWVFTNPDECRDRLVRAEYLAAPGA